MLSVRRGTHATLGATDVSSAVSGFCQVFIVTRAKPTPKISTAREKNLWYPGYTHAYGMIMCILSNILFMTKKVVTLFAVLIETVCNEFN